MNYAIIDFLINFDDFNYDKQSGWKAKLSNQLRSCSKNIITSAVSQLYCSCKAIRIMVQHVMEIKEIQSKQLQDLFKGGGKKHKNKHTTVDQDEMKQQVDILKFKSDISAAKIKAYYYSIPTTRSVISMRVILKYSEIDKKKLYLVLIQQSWIWMSQSLILGLAQTGAASALQSLLEKLFIKSLSMFL